MELPAFFDRWGGRTANALALWPFIAATGLGGVVTAMLSSSVQLINQFGAFGWWMAFLVGAALSALILWAAASARLRFAHSSVVRKWRDKSDDVNPLDPEFTRKRLSIHDLASPIDGRIRGKQFIDCELIGRANIVILGTTLAHTGFIDCDVVIARQEALIQNTIVLENCQIIGGKIYRCTIFVNQQDWQNNFQPIGGNLVSYEAPV